MLLDNLPHKMFRSFVTTKTLKNMERIRSTHFWFGLSGICHKFNILFYQATSELKHRCWRAPPFSLIPTTDPTRSTSICSHIWVFFCVFVPPEKNYCYKLERLHLMIYMHKSKIFSSSAYLPYIYILFGKCAPNALFNFFFSFLVRRLIA